MSLRISLAVVLAGSLLSCGFSHRQYKTELVSPDQWERCTPDLNEGSHFLLSTRCIATEQHYSFSIIEFDDSGEHWDRRQLVAVRDEIDRITDAQTSGQLSTDGILLITFIHGWRHNASEGSSNLRDFRDFIRRMGQREIQCQESDRNGDPCVHRHTLGVYLAWRGDPTGLTAVIENHSGGVLGEVVKLPQLLTFWNRKGAANRVAGIAATETILSLIEDLQSADRRRLKAHLVDTGVLDMPPPFHPSRKIFAGHSFGAKVLEHSMAQAYLGIGMAASEALARLKLDEIETELAALASEDRKLTALRRQNEAERARALADADSAREASVQLEQESSRLRRALDRALADDLRRTRRLSLVINGPREPPSRAVKDRVHATMTAFGDLEDFLWRAACAGHEVPPDRCGGEPPAAGWWSAAGEYVQLQQTIYETLVRVRNESEPVRSRVVELMSDFERLGPREQLRILEETESMLAKRLDAVPKSPYGAFGFLTHLSKGPEEKALRDRIAGQYKTLRKKASSAFDSFSDGLRQARRIGTEPGIDQATVRELQERSLELSDDALAHRVAEARARERAEYEERLLEGLRQRLRQNAEAASTLDRQRTFEVWAAHRPPADLVLLVNAASEALYAQLLIRAMCEWQRNRPEHLAAEWRKRPWLISVTSRADRATRYAFPAGARLGRLFRLRARGYQHDQSDDCDKRFADRQRDLLVRTAGHTKSLRSHTIRRTDGSSTIPLASDLVDLLRPREKQLDPTNIASGLRAGREAPDIASQPLDFEVNANNKTENYRLAAVSGAQNESQYWVVQAPKSLIRNHTDIFGPGLTTLAFVLFGYSRTFDLDCTETALTHAECASRGIESIANLSQ